METDPNRRLVLSIIRLSLFLALAGSAILVWLGKNNEVRGLIAGTLGSVADFALVAYTVSKMVPGDSQGTVRRMRLGIPLRYVAFGLPLYLGATNPSIDFLFACLGVFTVRFVLLLKHAVPDSAPDVSSGNQMESAAGTGEPQDGPTQPGSGGD